MNELKKNGSGYADTTAYKAIKNMCADNRTILRGDIYYIKKHEDAVGNEQYSNRPGIIVSNDIGNEHANIVEVVYLTSGRKKLLPTHTQVMCHIPSTALCEQIVTVAKERVGEFIRCCTDDEIERIDKAIMISLGLAQPAKAEEEQPAAAEVKEEKADPAENEVERREREVRTETEAKLYKALYEHVLDMLTR